MNKEKEEIVIEEFKTSAGKSFDSRKKKFQEAYMIPALFATAFLLAVLAGIFWLKLSVVLVCVILVLESLIGICLHDTPVWIHGVEIIIGIAAGIIFHETAIMIIGALIYIAAILALHFMGARKGQS